MAADIERHAPARIRVLDGAMGTMIQQEKPNEAVYRGDRFRAHPVDVAGWLAPNVTYVPDRSAVRGEAERKIA